MKTNFSYERAETHYTLNIDGINCSTKLGKKVPSKIWIHARNWCFLELQTQIFKRSLDFFGETLSFFKSVGKILVFIITTYQRKDLLKRKTELYFLFLLSKFVLESIFGLTLDVFLIGVRLRFGASPMLPPTSLV